MRYDRNIICPHCGNEQLQSGIPLVEFAGDGRIYQCEACREDYRVGMLLEPFISLLRGRKE